MCQVLCQYFEKKLYDSTQTLWRKAVRSIRVLETSDSDGSINPLQKNYVSVAISTS